MIHKYDQIFGMQDPRLEVKFVNGNYVAHIALDSTGSIPLRGATAEEIIAYSSSDGLSQPVLPQDIVYPSNGDLYL